LAFVNDENTIDFKKFELFINEITESYSSVQIAKIYINHIYGERNCLDFDNIYKMFEDCLIHTARSLNGKLVLSIYAKETVKSIIIQNAVNNEISKEDLMVWVLTDFPELFYGHHNWIVNNRVKNFKLNSNVSI
jgi:hypothetical protein